MLALMLCAPGKPGKSSLIESLHAGLFLRWREFSDRFISLKQSWWDESLRSWPPSCGALQHADLILVFIPGHCFFMLSATEVVAMTTLLTLWLCVHMAKSTYFSMMSVYYIFIVTDNTYSILLLA